jgi:hypothetical protein
VQTLHHLDVKGLERMAGGLDEEDASVDTVVNNVHPVDLVFGIQVGIEALFNVVHNRPPRFVVVHEVTKAGSVNYRQSETNTGLLNVCADGLDGNRLGNDVEAGFLALLGWVQRGVEEGVDKRRLSETGFTCVPNR